MDFQEIVFLDSKEDVLSANREGRIIHILCCSGNLKFELNKKKFTINSHDYSILPYGSIINDIYASDDFDAIIMAISHRFVRSIAVSSNYGVIGHLSLLDNPVIQLSEYKFNTFKADMIQIKQRLGEIEHRFRIELINHLLSAHILDLYDVHSQVNDLESITDSGANVLRKFIDMLYINSSLIYELSGRISHTEKQ